MAIELDFDDPFKTKKNNTDIELDFKDPFKVQAKPPQQLPEPVKEDPSWLRRIPDYGITALKGAISVPEAAVGIADIATQGRAGKSAEALFGFRPKEAKAALDEMLSPQQKEANKNVADAKGFVDTVRASLENSSTIVHSALESAPSMLGGSAVARAGVKALSFMPKVATILEGTTPAAKKIAQGIYTAAGAAGEGVVSMGQAAEQMRQENADGLLTGKQSLTAVGSGLVTGALGFVGGKIANKLGIGDLDTVLAGGKNMATEEGQKKIKGVFRRVIEAAISEGVFEELPQSAQEQIAQNYAMGRPLEEGVGEAAASGMLAGGLMGAFGGVNWKGKAKPEGGAPGGTGTPGATDLSPDGQQNFDALAQGYKDGKISKEDALIIKDVLDKKFPGIGIKIDELFAEPTGGDAATPGAIPLGPSLEGTPYTSKMEGEKPYSVLTTIHESLVANNDKEEGISDLILDEYVARGGAIPSNRPDLALRYPNAYVEPDLETVKNNSTIQQVIDIGLKEEGQAPELVYQSVTDRLIKQTPPLEQITALDDSHKTGLIAELERRSANLSRQPNPSAVAAANLTTVNTILDTLYGRETVPGPVGRPTGELERDLPSKVTGPEEIAQQREAAARAGQFAQNFQTPPQPTGAVRQYPPTILKGSGQNVEGQVQQAEVPQGTITQPQVGDMTAPAPLTIPQAGEGPPMVPPTPTEKTPSPVPQPTDIDQKAHEAATSPLNTIPQPTEPQIEAGNYQKGHVNIQGMDISIENPSGSTRSGVSKSGKAWSITMVGHYGYFKGTVGKDKDHIDTFIGDKPESTQAYVINQVDPETGDFDEHKVILGTNSEQEARDLYLNNYEKGWKGLGDIVPMTTDELKKWFKEGNTKKPASTIVSNDVFPSGPDESIGTPGKTQPEGITSPETANTPVDGQDAQGPGESQIFDASKKEELQKKIRDKLKKMEEEQQATSGSTPETVPEEATPTPTPTTPEATPQAKTPYDYGKEAFAKGVKGAPAHDADFMETLKGKPVGTNKQAFSEWLSGWTDANLAPRPGETETKPAQEPEAPTSPPIMDALNEKAQTLAGKDFNQLTPTQKKKVLYDMKDGVLASTLSEDEVLKIYTKADITAGWDSHRAFYTPAGAYTSDGTIMVIDQGFADRTRMDFQIKTIADDTKSIQKNQSDISFAEAQQQAEKNFNDTYVKSAAKAPAYEQAIPEVAGDELHYQGIMSGDSGMVYMAYSTGKTQRVFNPALVKVFTAAFGPVTLTADEKKYGAAKVWDGSGKMVGVIMPLRNITPKYGPEVGVQATTVKTEEKTSQPGIGTIDNLNTIALSEAFSKIIASKRRVDKTVIKNLVLDLLEIQVSTPEISRKLDQQWKSVEEAYEYAIVLAASEIARKDNLTDKEKYDAILDIYNNQPMLAERTSTSKMNQQYSTPAPIAYAISAALGITQKDKVGDFGGAGNGMLLMGAKPVNATAIELDKGARSTHLVYTGIETINDDATKELPPNLKKSQDAIIINPPFGTLPAMQTVDGYQIRKLEHLITLRALEGMRDNGRAGIIIGGHSFAMRTKAAPGIIEIGATEGQQPGSMTEPDRIFFNYLYSHYNVSYNVDVDGNLYKRQGINVPIRVIIIEGRRSQPDLSLGAPKNASQVQKAESFDDLWNVLKGEPNATKGTVRGVDSGKDQGVRDTPEGHAEPGQPATGNTRPTEKEGGEPGTDSGQRGDSTGGRGEGELRPNEPGGEGRPGPEQLSPGPQDKPPIGIFDASKKEELQKKIRDKLKQQEASQKPQPSETVTIKAPEKPKPVSDKTVSDVNESFPDKVINDPDLNKNPLKGPIKIFDESKLEELEKKLKDKLKGNLSMNPMLDPDLIVTALEVGGIYLQKTGNDLALWTEKMITGLGNAIKPWLNSVWMALQHYPQDKKFDAELMGDLFQAAGIEYEAGAKSQEELTQAMEEAFGKGILPYMDSVYNSLISIDGTPVTDEEEGKRTDDNEYQAKYDPMSGGPQGNNLIPKNIVDIVRKVLEDLNTKKGGIDAFLMKMLDYKSQDELYQSYSAEQLDAIALTLDAIGKRQGMIVGDQTGVGKGRVAAALIRYANLQGKKPIFMTLDPKLFTDIHRDLTDIKHTAKPFVLHKEKKTATIYDENEQPIFGPSWDGEIADKVRRGDYSFMDGYDYIVVSYPQIQNMRLSGTAEKVKFLTEWGKDNIVIMDEAHEAAGASTRRAVALEVLEKAQGVLYMSATYAKRPDVVPLYYRTKLGDTGMGVDDLINVMKLGGVPLQQIVAMQLTEAGQYIRRELDFSEVTFAREVAHDREKEDRKEADTITDSLRDIVELSAMINGWAASQNSKNNTKTTPINMRTQVTATNFASTVHNLITQMLLGLKAQTTIKTAVDAIEKNEKPVITLYNTMGTFLDYYVDEHNAKEGDEVGYGFKDVLKKALKGVLKVRTTNATGVSTVSYLDPDKLDPAIRAAYYAVQRKIEALVTNLPSSPIDYIKHGIEKEAKKRLGKEISVGEITGREWTIDYSLDNPVLSKRKERSKNKIVGKFNTGKYDAILFNSSGATGLSLHSSERFKDKRRRMGIVVQADLNIDKFMQGLGRIHRKGQVSAPYYIFLQTALPAEIRPGVILTKKMASLNANISANSQSAVSLRDVPDMMNRYGDAIMEAYLNRHQGVMHLMGIARIEGNTDLFKRISGKAALLPTAIQARMYDEIETEYKDHIDYLNQIGENDLVARDLDLRAKVLSRTKLHGGIDEKNPFQATTWLNKMQIKISKKPYNSAKIKEMFATNLNGKTPTQFNEDIANEIKGKVDAYTRDLGAQEAQLIQVLSDRYAAAMASVLRRFKVGSVYEVPIIQDSHGATLETVLGAVVNIKYDGKEGGHPGAPGRLKVTFAVNDGRQLMTFSAARQAVMRGSFFQGADSYVDRNWDNKLNLAAHETRYILTGNIFKSVQLVERADKRVDVITFTMEDGSVNKGVLLPKSANNTVERDFANKIVSWKDAHDWLIARTINTSITSANNNVKITYYPRGNDNIQVMVPSSNAKGSAYYTNEKLLALVEGNNFAGRWSAGQMGGYVKKENLQEFMRILGEEMSENFLVPVEATDIDITRGGEIDVNLNIKEWSKAYIERQDPHIARLKKVFGGAVGPNDVTNPFNLGEAHRAIVKEFKAYDIATFFFSGTSAARAIKGFVFPGAPRTIFINTNQQDWDMQETAKHESLHLLKQDARDIYDELLTKLSPLMQNTEDFKNSLRNAEASLGFRPSTIDTVTEELVARAAQGHSEVERYFTDWGQAQGLCQEAFNQYVKWVESTREDRNVYYKKGSATTDLSAYSITTPEKPRYTVPQVEKLLSYTMARWKDIGPVKIVQTDRELPMRYMKAVQEGGKIFGVYDLDTDTTYIVADNIGSPRDAYVTLAHEVVGHRGILALLGNWNTVNKVFAEVTKSYEGKPLFNSIVESYGLDMTKDRDRAMAASEMIAHMAEVQEKTPLLYKIYGMIREQLRKVFPGMKWTNTDIMNLIDRARNQSGAVLFEGQAMYKMENESVDSDKEPITFIGMQETGTSKPAIGLFNDTKNSTITYNPTKHTITNQDAYEAAIKKQGPNWKPMFRKALINKKPTLEETQARIMDLLAELKKNPEYKEAHMKMSESSVGDIIRDHKGLLGDFQARFGRPFKDDDMKLLDRIFNVPYWLAKKFESINKLVNTEIEAAERRSKMLYDMYENNLKDAQDRIVNAKKEQEFQDLVWKWDGRPFPKEDVTEPRFSGSFNDNTISINPKLGDQIKSYLISQGISRESAEGYAAVRQVLDGVLLDYWRLMKEFKVEENDVAEFRKTIGQIPNYFPHTREGDTFIAIHDKKGDTVYREHFSKTKEQFLTKTADKAPMRAQRWLTDAIATGKLSGTEADYIIDPVGPVTQLPDEAFFQIPVEAIDQILDVAASKTKLETGVDMKKALAKAVAETLKSRGWARHAIGRKNVPGHKQDDVFNTLFEHLSGFTGFKTKIERAKDHSATLRTIDAVERPQEYTYASKYVRDMLQNQDRIDRLVDGLRGIFFVKYLGAVIKSGIVNLTQNYIMAAPNLSVHTKHAEAKITKAMVDVRKALTSKEAWTGKQIAYEHLSDDDQWAIHQLVEGGDTADLYLRELMGDLPANSWAKMAKKVMSKGGIFMSLAEKFNRTSTGLAAYRIARKEKDMDKEAALAFARTVIYDSHFLYGKANLPELMRGGDPQKVMRAGYTFRSFSHNYILSILNLLTNQGREGKLAVLRSTRNLFLMGGLSSVPFISLIMPIIGALLGDDDDDYLTKVRSMMPWNWLKDMVVYGLPGVAGVDFSGSLSIEVAKSWGDVIGVPGAAVEDTMNMWKSYKSGQVFRALSETPITPMVVRNAMTAYRLATEGQMSRSGKNINYFGEIGPRKITTGEALLKGVAGFQPTSSSKSFSAYEATRKMEETVQGRKGRYADQFVNAMRTGDTDTMRQTLQEVLAWNMDHRNKPEMMIDLEGSIESRLKQGSEVPTAMRGRALQISREWNNAIRN